MPSISELTHGDAIKEALKGHAERLLKYQKFRAYYDGEHKMNYVSEYFRRKYAHVFREFADNLCRKVVDVPKSRTILERVDSGSDAVLDDWFRSQRIDAKQRIAHRDAFMCGDSYIVVWDDGSGPKLYNNRPELLCPVYDQDDPGRLICAVKIWCDTKSKLKRLRFSVYYDNQVERYTAPGDDLNNIENRQLTEYSDDGQEAIQKHEFKRVPVFHFANKGGPGEMGVSELSDVIPLQDALNKTVFDLLVNNEHISQAQRYATGVEQRINPETGQTENPFKDKSLWIAEDTSAKFGQLGAGDSTHILAVVRDFRQEIGLVSGIPTYYLNSDSSIPSGTALKVIEAPLRDKVEEAQVIFGNVWEDAFALATGTDVAGVNSLWRDTSPVSDNERLQDGVLKKALGFSSQQIWRELDYSDSEIEQIKKEREAEDKASDAREKLRMTRGGEF